MDSTLAIAAILGGGFALVVASSGIRVFWPDAPLSRWLDDMETSLGGGRTNDSDSGGDGGD